MRCVCVCVCVCWTVRPAVPVARLASAMVSFSDRLSIALLMFFCEMTARLLNGGESREVTDAVY